MSLAPGDRGPSLGRTRSRSPDAGAMTARHVHDAAHGAVGPIELRSRAGTALVAATVLASMVGFIDAYMINVAVPAISRDLGAGGSSIQSVLTSYLVTVASLLLLAVALADHFGWLLILVSGLIIMLIVSLCCAAAPNVGILIAARVVQGHGGAVGVARTAD